MKNLSRSTNIPSLAQHIVTTCQLIDPASVGEVEQLLLYLQARKTTKEGEAGVPFLFICLHGSIYYLHITEKDMLEASTKKLQKQMENLEVSSILCIFRNCCCADDYLVLYMQISEEASMVELDVYLEGLYDDLPAKTKSTGLILQLARLPENLIELANNGEHNIQCTILQMELSVYIQLT